MIPFVAHVGDAPVGIHAGPRSMSGTVIATMRAASPSPSVGSDPSAATTAMAQVLGSPAGL
jgi:hypothetical protein